MEPDDCEMVLVWRYGSPHWQWEPKDPASDLSLEEPVVEYIR